MLIIQLIRDRSGRASALESTNPVVQNVKFTRACDR
jgi:hypothetical protein